MRREDWDHRYAEAELLWGAGPNRFLVSEIGDLEPGRALDLACGEGRNAVWLAKRGWRVTAVDFSEVAIARARERAAHERIDVDLLCVDLLHYEPERGTYDLVVIMYLQIPADERRLVLSRASRALAPDGTLLLVGHDLENLAGGVGGPRDPAVLFTPGDIARELDGLAVEKAERVLRDVESADRPAIDTLVRARRPAR